MKDLMKLAFRNLLRNRRRSIATAVTFAIGMALVMVTVTIMKGSHEKTIEDGVRRTSGHLQIHYRGYQENQILYNSLELNRVDGERIAAREDVQAVLFRISTTALVESGGNTRLVRVEGLDAMKERPYGGLYPSLVQGDYLSEEDPGGVYLGEGLAKRLHVSPGSPLFLIGEARDMSIAAGKLHVRGVFRTGNPDLDRMFLLMNRSRAERIFVMDGFVTEVVLMLDENDSLDGVQEWLHAILSPEEEVIPWQELIPELVQYVAMDAAFGYLFLVVLALIIVFGVVNTILTSIMERRHEFAVILATGAPREHIFRLVLTESMLLSGFAVVMGLVLGIAASLYFVYNPIPITGESAQVFQMWGFEPAILGRLSLKNIIGSSLTFFLLGTVASIWPGMVAMRTEMARYLAGEG